MTKKDWIAAFDECDKEKLELYHRLMTLKMQELICEAVKTCDNHKELKTMLHFCCGFFGLKLIDGGLEEIRLEKEGVA